MGGFSQADFHPKQLDEDGINWIFVVDTLNFCFWSPGNSKWNVTYQGKTHTGGHNKNMVPGTYTYTLSEARSGVDWADLMAAQGAFGTDFYDRSTRTIVGTML